MLPATLTMAPIHPPWLTSRNEADSTAQAATFKLIGRATHNLILFASPRVSRFLALSLRRFARQESIAIDLKQPRLALAASAAEGIDRRADLNIDETAFFQHLPPACARQATGNSIGPEVDVADCRFRDGLAARDIGKLQASPRP